MLLGPAPVTRRVLAHEFAHLLGFDDAYLRGFEGSPGGPFGATLVEWNGPRDDLMANVEGGAVSESMVDALIQAYRKP